MVNKFKFPSRAESKKLHAQIIDEYNDMIEISNGKNIQKILEKLAVKHGYSCGQAVRNMMNNFNKKQLV